MAVTAKSKKFPMCGRDARELPASISIEIARGQLNSTSPADLGSLQIDVPDDLAHVAWPLVPHWWIK